MVDELVVVVDPVDPPPSVFSTTTMYMVSLMPATVTEPS